MLENSHFKQQTKSLEDYVSLSVNITITRMYVIVFLSKYWLNNVLIIGDSV